MANEASFRNCLVAMRPTSNKYDIPSSHDVSVYIHNKCIEWLNKLKDDIQVSEKMALEYINYSPIFRL